MHTDVLFLEVAAHLGKLELPLEAYYELQLGDILILNQKVEEPLLICVGDETRFLGSPGLYETHKAVYIHERIDHG